MLDKIGDVKALGGIALEKLTPRRDVEEQIAHFKLGASGPGDVAHGYQLAAVKFHLGAFCVASGFRP